MNKYKESIPIDLTHPEAFLGHEFYLAIPRDHLFEETDARIRANAGILRRAKWAVRDLVNLLRRRERKDLTDYAGTMIEVIDREPHSVQGYLWPEFNRVTFRDGTRVATTIPADEVFRSYMFVLIKAQKINGTGYKMSGIMKPYNLHDDLLQEGLEQRVDIEFDKAPASKEKGGHLVCF